MTEREPTTERLAFATDQSAPTRVVNYPDGAPRPLPSGVERPHYRRAHD